MKVRIKTQGLRISSTFATMNKLRNVGRARGRHVQVHNNGTATTKIPTGGANPDQMGGIDGNRRTRESVMQAPRAKRIIK